MKRAVLVKNNKEMMFFAVTKEILVRNLPFCSLFMVIVLITEIFDVKISPEIDISLYLIVCMFVCFTSVNYKMTDKIKNFWLKLAVAIGIGALVSFIFMIVALIIAINFRISIGGEL